MNSFQLKKTMEEAKMILVEACDGAVADGRTARDLLRLAEHFEDAADECRERYWEAREDDDPSAGDRLADVAVFLAVRREVLKAVQEADTF